MDIGHQIQVGVLAEGHIWFPAQGHQRRLHHRRGPTAQVIGRVEGGHERNHDAHATLLEVVQIFLAGALHDDGLVFQLRRRIAANSADVAGDHIGPQEGVGSAFVMGCAGGRMETAEGFVGQAFQRGRCGLFQGALGADQRQVGQTEVDDGVCIAHMGRTAHQRLGQAGMVQPRRKERPLFGKDAGLGAVGQDDRPAFQPAADAAAVHQR